MYTPRTHDLDLSIVIPTLNEERRIADVIGQFRELAPRYTYEVIVGDGGSTDRTAEIAHAMGATVVVDDGSAKTVASGRNAGAFRSRGRILVFCDADTLLSDVRYFADRVEHEFRDPNVVAAVPRMEVFPQYRLWKDRIFHRGFNALIKASFRMPVPFSRGQCQVIRADSFRAVGGYDAKRVHAEDSTIFRQLRKIGVLRFIEDVIIFESPRRYRKYGYIYLSIIAAYSIVAQAILGRNVLDRWERVEETSAIVST